MTPCCNRTTFTCSLSTISNCNTAGGLVVPTGTVCSPNPCPALFGACCSVFGGTCTIEVAADCSTPVFQAFQGGGTVCTPTTCATACCDPTTSVCRLSSAINCNSSGGTLLSPGTACTPNPCPGACCDLGGQCTFVAQDACNGTFIAGTCSPSPCPGACCNLNSGSCEFKPRFQCDSSNGIIFFSGVVCTPNPCPRGACCNSFFTQCRITAPFGCSSFDYRGNGTVCDPNPCPAACCDPATGACMVQPQNTCAGRVLLTSTCTPNPCPPVAKCRNIVLDSRLSCISRTVTAQQIDNGSFAATQPCAVTLLIDNAGPFPVGDTVVTLTVTDCNNRVSTCQAVVRVLANDCNRDTIPDICQCLWDSGPVAANISSIDGQLSHLGGGARDSGGGAKVADDFYLCPGRMHRIFDFQGFMLTDLIAPLRKARLELFEDCNGRPSGTPIRTFETLVSTELAGPNADGFFLVRYDFDFCEEETQLWLEGGRTYWWSLMGLGTCTANDLSSWAVAPGPVVGSPPVKADGLGYGGSGVACYPSSFDAWAQLDECCIGCVNMAYNFHGVACPIIWDNGPALLGAAGGGILSENLSPSQRPRGADDFVIKPCDDERLCLIDAWVWSSCNPIRGFVEIYRNDCRKPGTQFVTLTNPEVIPTNETLVIGGLERRGYILRFGDLNLTLPGNQTWWLSAGADRTGSQNARTYFAIGGRCETCARHGFTSQSFVPPAPVRWRNVGPDLAFRIAAEPRAIERALDITNGPVVARCAADVNGDGDPTLQDIFDYLTAYFAGCP